MYVISIFQGLLTPFIGIIAVYIAWQQWQGNRLKLKMDKYDRGLRIYQEVVKMLRKCSNRKLEWADVIDFGSSTAEADFLFGPDIRQYIDEIVSRAVALIAANAEYRDITQPVPAEYDPNKVVQEMMTQARWFREQLVGFVAKNKFGKYLNIS